MPIGRLVVLRVWHLLAVVMAVLLISLGVGAALLFARGGDGRTQTVVHVMSVGSADDVTSPDNEQAKAVVRNAIPAIEAYNADTGGYSGMTLESLYEYDPSVGYSLVIVYADDFTYCVQTTIGVATWSKNGPDGEIGRGVCPEDY